MINFNVAISHKGKKISFIVPEGTAVTVTPAKNRRKRRRKPQQQKPTPDATTLPILPEQGEIAHANGNPG